VTAASSTTLTPHAQRHFKLHGASAEQENHHDDEQDEDFDEERQQHEEEVETTPPWEEYSRAVAHMAAGALRSMKKGKFAN
jgi:hypothetical protein